MSVIDVTSDVERSGEPSRAETDNKKRSKVYFVEIFRIEKQVGNSQVLAKTSRDHCKKYDPAQHQHMIALQVIEQQLNRKGVSDLKG